MKNHTSSFVLVAERTFERIVVLERDMAVIKSNYATKEDVIGVKEDMAKLEVTLRNWFVGTAVTLTGLAFAATRFIN
jgi:hypothetical protein